VSTLHITNGDAAADTMRTFLRDPVITMIDVLHEGSAPMTETLEEWHEVRARCLSSEGYTSYEDALRGLTSTDEQIAEAPPQYDEVVFWFEHDLFDQLLLIRALDLIGGSTEPAPQANVSLICIDRYPGVEPFYGLGQLNAVQLATLTDTRVPVTPDQYALAEHAWAAFRAADPRELAQVAHLTTSSERARAVLPFLGDALTRFLAEYPSVAHGLSRSEELTLSALREGASTAGELFRTVQARETSPFMGDWTFYSILRRLASARTPLLSIDELTDDVDLRPLTVTMTEAGRDVIEGREDGVALNGIDLWRGGVHLVGQNRSPWRWDAWRETLVS
jgi:Domain of unknown function (DUF1835)